MFSYKSVFCLIALISGPIAATEITLVTEHLAPFQIIKKNQEITGFSTDIVKAALARTPYSYTIEANPWNISYNQALKNSNTCIFSLAYTPSRKPLFQWAGELTRSTLSFYSLSSRNITITNINEAKNFNVAVIRDDVSHQYLLSKGFTEQKNIYVMDNYDALLDLLEKRKSIIDLVILNDELLKNRIKNLSDKAKYRKVFEIKDLTLIFNIGCNLKVDKKIVDDISKALNTIKADGTYQKIKNKWRSYF